MLPVAGEVGAARGEEGQGAAAMPHVHAVVSEGRVAEVRRLIAAGADAEQADAFGNTALYACHYGHAAVAQLLVAEGCRDDATLGGRR